MSALATPIRAAVFRTVEQARRTVDSLRSAGVPSGLITVMCSDEATQHRFAEFEHQHPAGAHTVEAAALGSSIGAALGGVAVAAGAVASGGVMALAGGVVVMSGAAVGGLIGAMLTRGGEHELADHYAQAVVDGQILVAVDTEDSALQAAAEQVFAAEGALSRDLPEG